MEPRRLTDGALANTNNAWGQAALEQATSSSGAGQARASSKLGTADASSPAGSASDRADSSRSDWYLPSSVSGVSSGGGWLSRPTTGAAAVTASRATTAVAGSPLPGEPSSPAVPGGLGKVSACAVSKGCCLGLPAAQCARSVQPGCLLVQIVTQANRSVQPNLVDIHLLPTKDLLWHDTTTSRRPVVFRLAAPHQDT
jgi:hypothetical protein